MAPATPRSAYSGLPITRPAGASAVEIRAVTDTVGLLLTVVVLSASVQDRDGAQPALLQTYLFTGVRFVFADGGFAGRLLDWAQALLRSTLHIVRKPADQRGFAVIPRRWAGNVIGP